jgi:hypothetical protein
MVKEDQLKYEIAALKERNKYLVDIFLFVKMFSAQENDKLINCFYFSKVTYQVPDFQNKTKKKTR